MAKHDKESRPVSPRKGEQSQQLEGPSNKLDTVTWTKHIHILAQAPVLDSFVKAWLTDGVSIVWVSKILISLQDWTGPVPGFDYDKGQPSRTTINRWNVWRYAGYERMLERVLRRLKELEVPNHPKHYLPIGGRTLLGKLYFAPSRIHQKLSKFAHWAKTGWKPHLSITTRCDPRDAFPYIRPEGFEIQEGTSFSFHIRTWDELLETPQILRLISSYEDQFRDIFQQSLLDLRYVQSVRASDTHCPRNFKAILTRLRRQVPSYETLYPSCSLFPDGATYVFSSPIDKEWKERREWSPLEKMEFISKWKAQSSLLP